MGALLLFLACASAPRLVTPPPSPVELLRQDVINVITRPALAQASMGVMIVSLGVGDTLVSHDADRVFHPASNTKLFTAVSAMNMLGREYRFNTVVSTDSAAQLRDRTLEGPLYLCGEGDPRLDTTSIHDLADQIARRGIQTITGDLITDETRFDTLHLGPGWMWDDMEYDFSPQLSALTVNANCVTVIVRPGARVGDPVSVTLDPPTAYMAIRVTATTGPPASIVDAGSSPLRVERDTQSHDNLIVVSGVVPLSASAQRILRTVENPARYTATLLQEALAAHGVTLQGGIRSGVRPPNSAELGRIESPPLTDIIRSMLKESDNLSADQLIKVIGAQVAHRPGSMEDGVKASVRSLRAVAGLDSALCGFVDGSGLSWYNLVAPSQTIKLLTYAYRDSMLRAPLMDALPVAGIDGTLKNRMISTPATRRILAKTGTLSGVTCLSGYALTQEDEPLVFSIMINNYIGPSLPYRRAQDDICALLATFSRKKTLNH